MHTRADLLDQYEARVRDAWHALADVLDDPQLGDHRRRRVGLRAALRWLEMETACGDCEEGRCHWGGEKSRESIAAAEAGHEYAEPCPCDRHPFSAEVRQRHRQWDEQARGAVGSDRAETRASEPG